MKENAASRASAILLPGGEIFLTAGVLAVLSARRSRAALPDPHALATKSAISDKICARRGCSSACTRPRCRSGSATDCCRGSAPSTRMPAASMPARASASWRGLATRLSTTPASATSLRSVAKPSAVAAADCACPDMSSTSTTGQPARAAISALAPVPVSPDVATPSNNPIEPSASTRSAPSAACISDARCAGCIAQLSRLSEARPDAAA